MLNKLITHFGGILKVFILQKYKKNQVSDSDVIHLFTEGRGGGTWLMELVSSLTFYLTIFEPLDGSSFSFDKRFASRSFPFYHDNKIEDFKEVLNNIIKLKGFNKKNVMFNSLTMVLNYNGLAVKFANKTLLLHDPNYRNILGQSKILVLLRNPLEIINSRIKYGFQGFETEENISVEELFFISSTHPLNKHMPFFMKLKTNYELYVAEWCATYSPFLLNPEKFGGVHVIRYKDLKEEPNKTLQELEKFLNTKASATLDTSKKSFTTKRMFSNSNNLSLKPDFEKRMNLIFQHFGLDEIIKEV